MAASISEMRQDAAISSWSSKSSWLAPGDASDALPRKASALLGPSSVGVVEGLDVLVDWPDDKGVVPQELPCALTPSAPAVAPVLTEEEEGGRSLHESLRPCILVCKSLTAPLQTRAPDAAAADARSEERTAHTSKCK